MTKQELRKLYSKKRLNLSDSDYVRFSRMISDRFFTRNDLNTISTLNTFLPIVKNKEPDTWLMVKRLKQEFPHIRISIPRVSEEALSCYYYEGPDQLKISSWGIPEPVRGSMVDPIQIDIVIVPLLAFDEKGHRVGYGKGYYDKFMRSCRPDCTKVGLSFFPPVTEIKDIFEADLPLDEVITPDAIYTFGS